MFETHLLYRFYHFYYYFVLLTLFVSVFVLKYIIFEYIFADGKAKTAPSDREKENINHSQRAAVSFL